MPQKVLKTWNAELSAWESKVVQVESISEQAQNLSENLKNQVGTYNKSIPFQGVSDAADLAQRGFSNATGTIAGQFAGQVQGGIQSLTQKADAFKGELSDAKDTVEGLLDGDMSSLENMATDMVNNAIGGLLSKFGAKVEVQFSEPDSNGIVTPIASTLGTDTTAADKIQGVLTLITGLGVDVGNLQKVITEASPAGLLDAGKNLVAGKIGAVAGADALKALANESIKSVTDDLVSKVGPALASAANLNKVVNKITSIDSNGFGEFTYNYDTITSTGPTDSSEFNSMITNFRDNSEFDLKTLITDASEVKQNLEAAKVDLENLSGGKDGGEVLRAIQSNEKQRQNYSLKEFEYKSIVQTRVGKNSQSGIIQGLSNETISQVKKDIRKFAPGITDENVNKVIALSQGDAADESEAVRILAKASGQSYDVVRRFLDGIDTTIYDATRPPIDKSVFSDPYVIGSYQKQWNNGQGNPVFPYVSSVEELQAEIRTITREVKTVIVHWTETHTNKNIGSEEINQYHIDAGIDGIGYHYVIRRDGSLQRGRPVNIVGAHTTDFNLNTIGIVFVGGINAPTGTPNSENFLSSQSLTRSQLNTFDHFCRTVYNVYPGMNIVGHSDVDATGENIDPGFDVPDYVNTRFGK
jgi:hypothetical protein